MRKPPTYWFVFNLLMGEDIRLCNLVILLGLGGRVWQLGFGFHTSGRPLSEEG